MAYGIIKVDNITFNSGGIDESINVSGLYNSITSGFSVTGTFSGATVQGGTISGVTLTGTTGLFTSTTVTTGLFTTATGVTANFISGVYTGRISGTTITGVTGQFTNFTAVSGVFTSQVSGAVITGVSGQFTTLTGATGNFGLATGVTAGFATATFGTVTLTGGVTAANITGAAFVPTGTAAPVNGMYLPAANTVGFTANSAQKITIGTGELVINDIGAIYNFRVEGDTNQNLLYVDGASDRIGIGTSSPATRLELSGAYCSNVVTLGGSAIDCSLSNYFSYTIDSDTTFTVSNVPAAGKSYSFVLELTYNGGNITWPSGTAWPGDAAPVLITSKTHLFIFQTDNGGARWRANFVLNYTT